MLVVSLTDPTSNLVIDQPVDYSAEPESYPVYDAPVEYAGDSTGYGSAAGGTAGSNDSYPAYFRPGSGWWIRRSSWRRSRRTNIWPCRHSQWDAAAIATNNGDKGDGKEEAIHHLRLHNRLTAVMDTAVMDTAVADTAVMADMEIN